MSDSVSPSPRADCRAGAEEPAAPSVEVVHHTERIAVVHLIGEHDIAMKRSVLDALASATAQPCVVVDLSRCTFVDSSVINVMVALRNMDVCTVTLVVPDTQRAVRRTFEIVRMDHFFTLHDSLAEALLAAAADGDDALQTSIPEVKS
jgi:anti-anti-sigma factor